MLNLLREDLYYASENTGLIYAGRRDHSGRALVDSYCCRSVRFILGVAQSGLRRGVALFRLALAE